VAVSNRGDDDDSDDDIVIGSSQFSTRHSHAVSKCGKTLSSCVVCDRLIAIVIVCQIAVRFPCC